MHENPGEELLQSCLDRYYHEILNFMYLRVGNRTDAEDLTQDTFLAAVKGINQYRREASLRTWIFSIARRTLADAYQRKTRSRRLLEKLTKQFVFRRGLVSHEEHTELFSLLSQLQEGEREIIILKHYFGFSYEEISAITGLTSSNVGVKLSRAIQKCKSLVEGG